MKNNQTLNDIKKILTKFNGITFALILYILAHELKGPIANMYMVTNLVQSVDDMNSKIKLLNS